MMLKLNRIDNLDSKIDTLESKVCNIDTTVATLATKVDENHTFLSNRIDSVNKSLINFIIQQTQFNDDTDKKFLDVDKYFQDYDQHITTIEKAVNSTAEKFQDHLKMVDVRKAEISDEISKSVSESSEHLDQKIDISSQSLRSEMQKLSDRLNVIQQRVHEATLNRPSSTFSTLDRRTPVDRSVTQLRTPNIINNDIGSNPTEPPVVHNNNVVFPSRVELHTTPQISSSANHVPNYSNTDRPMLNYSQPDPLAYLYESGGMYICESSFLGQPPNKKKSPVVGLQPEQQCSNVGNTSSLPPLNFDITSHQNVISDGDSPKRTMPVFDGNGNIDIFFTKF